MSLELLNTSAPHGLHPSSSGFCTVEMTAGLPASVEQRLALLSGYRSLVTSGESAGSTSPIAWSHWRLSIGPATLSVLSRVSDAGADYSGRSNRLAHHLILDREEQLPAGPAWLLRQPGLMKTTWDGTPRLLESGREIPQTPRPIGPCEAWETATGDAGWAGVLAQHFVDHPAQVANLAFHPGLDLLPLIDEAIALLPPQRRWEVSFSTYFTEAPAGVACNWRGCAIGTRAASEAQQATAGALLLDLTRPLGVAPDTAATRAARRGEVLSPLAADLFIAPANRIGALARPPGNELPPSRMAGLRQAAERESAARPANGGALPAPAAPASPGNAPARGGAAASARASQATATALAPARQSSLWAWLALVLCLVTAGMIALAVIEQRLHHAQLRALTNANDALRVQLTAQQLAPNAGVPRAATAPRNITATAPPAREVDRARLQQLESENHVLLSRLQKATQFATTEPTTGPATTSAAELAASSTEIDQLRAELSAAQAELARLRATEAVAATEPAPTTRAAREPAGVDVLDESLVLWRDNPAAQPAEGIDLVHPSTPPGLAIVARRGNVVALRDLKGNELATISLQAGRVQFSWLAKQKFLDIPGAAAFLAGAEVRVRSADAELAHRPLVAPLEIRFDLSETTTPLPAVRGGWGIPLGLDVPAPSAKWDVAVSNDGTSATFKNYAEPAATFDVAIDRSDPIASIRTNWSAREQSLVARPGAHLALQSFPPTTLVLLDPVTHVARCEIILFISDSRAGH